MNFTEMDPEKIRELLDEKDESGNKVYQDVLTPLVSKEDSFFRVTSCPKCGGQGHEAFVDPRRPFVSGSVLPHRLLRCLYCRAEFDPYTRLVTRVPTDG